MYQYYQHDHCQHPPLTRSITCVSEVISCTLMNHWYAAIQRQCQTRTQQQGNTYYQDPNNDSRSSNNFLPNNTIVISMKSAIRIINLLGNRVKKWKPRTFIGIWWWNWWSRIVIFFICTNILIIVQVLQGKYNSSSPQKHQYNDLIGSWSISKLHCLVPEPPLCLCLLKTVLIIWNLFVLVLILRCSDSNNMVTWHQLPLRWVPVPTDTVVCSDLAQSWGFLAFRIRGWGNTPQSFPGKI